MKACSPPTRFFVAFMYTDKTKTTDWTTDCWKGIQQCGGQFFICHQTRREVHMVDSWHHLFAKLLWHANWPMQV